MTPIFSEKSSIGGGSHLHNIPHLSLPLKVSPRGPSSEMELNFAAQTDQIKYSEDGLGVVWAGWLSVMRHTL